MDNGKGDKRRPMSVSQDKYYENWHKIFKKTKETKTKIKKNNRED